MRDDMVQARKRLSLTRNALARIVEVNEVLIDIVENGGVTAPGIARRIGRVLGFSEEQIAQLTPPPRPPEAEMYNEGRISSMARIMPKKTAKAAPERPKRWRKGSVAVVEPKLKALLKDNGTSMREVSLAVGKSDAWLRMCTVYGRMDRRMAERVAKILGVSMWDFCDEV